MDSSLSTLSKLFTEKLFRIPDYQRGYSWTEKQLKDFWTDLDQLTAEQRHYTGVLTLESVLDKAWKKWDDDAWVIQGKNFKPYFVVDGQQRLTTIIILLQCILEKTKADAKLNFSTKTEIQQKFIFVPKTTHLGSYVFGYAKDNPSYECLKTRILGKTSTKYSTGETTIYTKNLINAKNFFSGKIASLTHAEVEAIYTKVTQRLLFNVFHIDEEVDVHVAFETMNNRGLQLSNLELLKNRLIYLTTKLGENQSNIETTRKTINDCWKTVYYFLGKNSKRSLSDDYLLFVHFVIYFGQKALEVSPKLFESGFHLAHRHDYYKDYLLEQEFNVRRIYATKPEERLSSTALLNYALDLKRVSENFYALSFPEDTNYAESVKMWLERLKRLRGVSNSREVMVATLLFLPQFKDDKSRVEFLELVERYFFVSNLLPYSFRRKSKPAKIAEELVKLVSKRTGLEEFTKLVKSEMDSWSKIPDFKNALLDGLGESSYYAWGDVKYFLFEYEVYLKDKVKRKTDKIVWDDYLQNNFDEDHASVEHILPQTISFPYWKDALKGYDAKKAKKLKNSLGNLVAISSPRNSSLRNKPFPEKKGTKELKTGYLFDSYSENEIALNQDWGPVEILERGIRLLDFMETRWDLKLGDRVEKKKLLGLDFMD
jgi:hypothetical protein